MTAKKHVYTFEKGDSRNKKLLGGKGAGLCEMTSIGLPVPPGFVITTEACLDYYEQDRKLPADLMEEVAKGMRYTEQKSGKGFGDVKNPLLVSVRSGAAISMPGMMDSILNLGLNDETVAALAKNTKNERFAYDSYRRFISMFCRIALGVPGEKFDRILEESREKAGVSYDSDLSVDVLKKIVSEYKEYCREATGSPFPAEPMKQLELAIEAVFRSWESPRCIAYRKEFNITKDVANGTAVNVVTMVFGNMGDDSATGVAFTRDPGTGENKFFGEYLTNAQGEDVVAGIRTPKTIDQMKKEMPAAYEELDRVRHLLENHYHEVQDFEFTIERGTLYMLQTRNGKMNAMAAVRTSVEMMAEGLIGKEKALLRVKPAELDQLMHRRLDPKAKITAVAEGIGASPGVAVGIVVFDADEAERLGRTGRRIILVREETKPEDVHGFFGAQGILTSRGGKTSHAAVVARGMGKPCVCGCENIKIDTEKRLMTIGEVTVKEGETITIEGGLGRVYLGEVPTLDPEFGSDLQNLLSWADEAKRLDVMANADTPEMASRSRRLGAQGIGLCRTERMFNLPERLPIVQAMILSETREERQHYLDELMPLQKKDFLEILRTMEGLPVTIRLLDPPLHEFLPSLEALLREVGSLTEIKDLLVARQKTIDEFDHILKHQLAYYASSFDVKEQKLDGVELDMIEELLQEKGKLLTKVRNLTEVNPMLGHRGVRVGLAYPEIYEMQIRAIYEATAELFKEGVKARPEIMVPQVCTAVELDFVRGLKDKICAEVEKKFGMQVKIKLGTMVEVVRACMRADRIAEIAEFFSFGTNDLTQATFSFSREDAENKFLPLYNKRGILQDNPFETIDVNGVGRLMKTAIEWGRRVRPELKVGICGEQGGDPRSIEFCHAADLNYVSCSPFRIPIARLAAAHAQIKDVKMPF
ncbi:MAG: pyruvate, phosphate dikinase [Smithellaceae bacterium]|nr:pyruvate, phosphate dikinase [Smithellaceae bacterium]